MPSSVYLTIHRLSHYLADALIHLQTCFVTCSKLSSRNSLYSCMLEISVSLSSKWIDAYPRDLSACVPSFSCDVSQGPSGSYSNGTNHWSLTYVGGYIHRQRKFTIYHNLSLFCFLVTMKSCTGLLSVLFWAVDNQVAAGFPERLCYKGLGY